MEKINKATSNAIKTKILHVFADSTYTFEFQGGTISKQSLDIAVKMILDTYRSAVENGQ